MREIKKFVGQKKTNNKIIGIEIEGVIKRFPISNSTCDVEYSSNNQDYFVNSRIYLTVKTNANNLIELLLSTTLNNKKINIYIGSRFFNGCFVTSYSKDLNNIVEFTILVDYFVIN